MLFPEDLLLQCLSNSSSVYAFSLLFDWLSPHFSKKKRGLCVTVRPPACRQQFTSISSYTIDARITKTICMIPLCIQMLATYLKFFSVFQFWNNSDFSDFTQKCNFSVNYEIVYNFLSVWGKSYTSYIKRVLSCDFQITLENRNVDGGGRRM